MKALSIRQPWAWAILHAGKRIENRDWKGCSYRGPLLIHAAKGCTRAEYFAAKRWMFDRDLITVRAVTNGPGFPPLDEMGRGGIVGVCDIVDVVRESVDPWFAGPIGLVLANVRPLPIVPFKGALGLFEVPDNLVPEAFR